MNLPLLVSLIFVISPTQSSVVLPPAPDPLTTPTQTKASCGDPIDQSVKKTLIKVEDIPYWDLDQDPTIPQEERDSIKESIVEELSSPLESHRIVAPISGSEVEEEICICTKLFGPVVCDQRGGAHSNICTFLCAQRKARCKGQDELKPNKILARVNPGDEGVQCKVPEEELPPPPQTRR